MQVPEDVLENQICSRCQMYLSVGPVKVHPDQRVTCGRCSRDDDNGIVSSLFEKVTKYMVFPCVNRYDGCSALHPMGTMDQHEKECHGDYYSCSMCQYRGTAYFLNIHYKKYHKEDTLELKQFLIDLNKNRQFKEYLYCEGPRLFFVNHHYDHHSAKLQLEEIFVGKFFKRKVFYSFKLFSIDNKLQYETNRLPCTSLHLYERNVLTVDTRHLKFRKNIVVCRFSIHEEFELVAECKGESKQKKPTIEDVPRAANEFLEPRIKKKRNIHDLLGSTSDSNSDNNLNTNWNNNVYSNLDNNPDNDRINWMVLGIIILIVTWIVIRTVNLVIIGIIIWIVIRIIYGDNGNSDNT